MSPPRPKGLRLLVTSAGRRVELIEAFRASAADLGIALTVIACDQFPELSAACHRADHAFAAPPAIADDYVPALLAAVAEHGVDLVVPTIDPELGPLAAAAPLFAAAGVDLVLSSPELVAMTADKLATAQFLARHGLPSPYTMALEDAQAAPQDWHGPLFIKPRFGSASRGVRAVASIADLAGEAWPEPMIAQTLLTGTEFTINIYCDRAGQIRAAVPHERLRVRAGEVEKGITRRHPRLMALARQLAAVLPGPRGALCFQAMVPTTGDPQIFEINARFGGGYPLAHHAGAPFARWLLEDALKHPSSAHDDWHGDVMMLRYDSNVFVAA